MKYLTTEKNKMCIILVNDQELAYTVINKAVDILMTVEKSYWNIIY